MKTFLCKAVSLLGGLALTLVVLSTVSGAETNNTDANCSFTEGPALGQSPAQDAGGTGGSTITFGFKCTGTSTVVDEVVLRLGETALFMAKDTTHVSGQIVERKEIHLPPPPQAPGVQLCVKVNNTRACIPPSA